MPCEVVSDLLLILQKEHRCQEHKCRECHLAQNLADPYGCFREKIPEQTSSSQRDEKQDDILHKELSYRQFYLDLFHAVSAIPYNCCNPSNVCTDHISGALWLSQDLPDAGT